MTHPKLLEIVDLNVALPLGADRRHAVQGVSIDLGHDEIVCVVGESGSGKSVMSRAIMGLLPAHVRPTGGKILYEGEDLLRASPERMRGLRGDRITMIFQEPMVALNPLMTIGTQIEEVIRVHSSLTPPQRHERVLAQLNEVGLPDPPRVFRAYPHELSGGQRQRAMIAMALVLEPAVLIADEPTTALDVTTQAQILRLIKELQAKHRTGVLFITHDFGVVADIADRVAVMQHGVLVEFGPADQILNAPQHAYTRALIAAIPPLKPKPPRPRSGSPVLLEATGIAKNYRTRSSWLQRGQSLSAVNRVDLAIRRGDTLGLVGESGSGKSTLGRCLIRLIEPDAGTVRLGEMELTGMSRRQLRPHRSRIQMVFQDPFASLNPRMTAAELIAQGPIAHGVPTGEAMAAARGFLALVGLEPAAANRYPHEFSGGQRQRIGIARALAVKPDVLIADEPVSALDVSVQARVLQLLAEIRERLHLTMLFITHDLRVAAQVCDDIAVMRMGEIVERGSTAEVFANPQHPYTRSLLSSVPGGHWKPPPSEA